MDHPEIPSPETGSIEPMLEEMLKPLEVFATHKSYTQDPDVNPNYIRPQMFMFRLQKIMDEYAGGASSGFKTSAPLLKKGLEHLALLKEDIAKMAAEDTHELMRCWENIHRLWQAESHMRTMLFREETRWPGYYFRSDFPGMSGDWKCFANCRWDPGTGQWEMLKKEVIDLV
jgi:adenylylsulfate reductase subunit A